MKKFLQKSGFIKSSFALSLATTLAITSSFSAYAVENWEKVSPGTYQMVDNTTFSGVLARGIDVSRWQGNIDWKKVSQDDIQFAMIATRSRQTGQADPYFFANMNGAMQNNIKLGAYIYSYATTVEEAKKEAEFVLNLIKDYPISYPIAFDVEDEPTQGKMPKAQLTELIDTFAGVIKDAGYYPIIYASDYWLGTKLEPAVSKRYPVWVARYNKYYVFPNPVMWQGTSTGKIDGISGNVDLNFQFQSFEGKTPANTWRTILGERYYYKNYIKQVNTWANDGNTKYYLSDTGTPVKGWFSLSGKDYYFNPNSGAMTTGWKKFNHIWTHFGGDGILSKGWIQDTGNWYFLDKNGIMRTGWIQTAGKKYFLFENGSMAMGWNKQNNTWFYLGSDGSMRTGWIQDAGNWYFLDSYGNMMSGWLNHAGKIYYLSNSGAMRTGWIQEAGNWFYLGSDGSMRTGWIQDAGNWYFLDQNGKMLTGLVQVNGKFYMLENNGRMLQDTDTIINEQSYHVSSNGEIEEYTTMSTNIISTGGAVSPNLAFVHSSTEMANNLDSTRALEVDTIATDNILQKQNSNMEQNSTIGTITNTTTLETTSTPLSSTDVAGPGAGSKTGIQIHSGYSNPGEQ